MELLSHVLLFFHIFLPLILAKHCTNNHRSSPPKHVCDFGRCSGKDGPTIIGRVQGLHRYNGVKVGHRQEVDLGEDGKVSLNTRSMRPLLFEIPNFLSDDECEYIIRNAENTEMFSSIAKGGLTEIDTWKFTSNIKGKADGPRGKYENWDLDMDGNITIDEIRKFAAIQRYLYLTEDEIKDIFINSKLTELDDGVITKEEFENMNTMLIDSYLYEMSRTHPKHRQRYSDQAWLDQKSDVGLLGKIQERVRLLTNLSREIIYGSEYLQVLRYTVDGHYHAHYDTETHEHPEIPCCHQKPVVDPSQLGVNKCKLCRYITILFYLNDVEQGGETAFPIADNATVNKDHVYNQRLKGKDLHNMNEFCHSANLVVKATRGTAIMWYNHLLNENTDWLGDRDEYSVHGGCKIKKGIKWAANYWITAPYNHNAHDKSIYLPWGKILLEKDNKE